MMSGSTSLPPQLPGLQIIGDLDAAVCIDGVCEIPERQLDAAKSEESA